MEKKWFLVFLVFVCVKMTYSMAPCTSFDSFHIGCYKEQASDREFNVSAGNYNINASNLNPGLCLRLCALLSYKYAALQNGNFCMCGNTYGSHGAASTCTKPCPGDSKEFCGGEFTNNVYNSTPFIGIFQILTPDKPFTLFNKENLTVSFTNGIIANPGISIDDGQGSGFSPFSSAHIRYSYRTTTWGIKLLKARNSMTKDFNTVYSHVKVSSPVKHVLIGCPKYVEVGKMYVCKVLVYQGTDMKAEWTFSDGSTGNQSLSDPGYHGIGPAVPQWTLVSTLVITAPLHSSEVFLIPSSAFISDAMVLALEVYGHTAGTVTIFIARPQCTLDSQLYCIKNATCVSSLQNCTTKMTRNCTAPKALSLTSSSCQDIAFCNSSLPAPMIFKTAAPAVTYTVVCVMKSITIQTGYNLYVLPDNKACQTKKGDILGWAIDGAGRIAHQNDVKKVIKYTSLSLPITEGQNITKETSHTNIALEYLLKAIGAEAAAFVTEHTINKEGTGYISVQVGNNMTSFPVKTVEEVRAQRPLTWISVVYPEGFDYFGTRKNVAVELLVNVSSAANVTIRCKNATTRERLYDFVNQDSVLANFFLSKANHTFDQEGFFSLYIEVFNEISSLKTTINVFVGGEITGLNGNLSQPDQPVYIGLQTGLVASVLTGSRLRYKWIIENDNSGMFIENTSTSYNFKEEGLSNVTIIASNQAYTSAMSFTVLALNPLSVHNKAWSKTDTATTFSSTLKRPFDGPQTYIWNFGDGFNKTGINLVSVQHTFTKGGQFNVSCRIQNEALIIAQQAIFILEPVTGMCLRPFTGVKLEANKTFIAEYATGNNVTFDWALQGSFFALLAVCSDKYFTYRFSESGAYNISLRIWNAISSISCHKTFFVDERISNLSIKAYPNPAPSNSTVSFEISKINGTNITYTMEFGDRSYLSHNDAPQWTYNRSFTAKQWQVVLTANNSVSEVITFYSLTVQDTIENIEISVNNDGIYLGKPCVIVGANKELRSQVQQGTDVFFRWLVLGNIYENEGSVQKTGESIVLRSQTFNKEQSYQINVTAFNKVSSQSYCLVIYAQDQIEGFVVEARKGVVINQEFPINFQQSKGSNVAYRVSFDDGSPDVTTSNSYVKKMFTSHRTFTVVVTASNQVSNISESIQISVQTKIEGLTCWPLEKVTAVGKTITFFWNVTSGSDVTFHINYNDGSDKQMIKATSNPVGATFNATHLFESVQNFQVEVTARNYLPESNCVINVQIEQPIINPEIYVDPKSVAVFEVITVEVRQEKGSDVKYTYDFGDGLEAVQSTEGKMTYRYRYPNSDSSYKVNVTAANPISRVSLPLVEVSVSESIETMKIQGLQVIAKPAKVNDAIEIRIIAESGTDYDCTLWGDGLPETVIKYVDLKKPIPHTYTRFGTYIINTRCKNNINQESASVITTVEIPIEGPKFKENYQSIELEYGKPKLFKWSWDKGSHVKSSVGIIYKGKIIKTILTDDSSINITPEYIQQPGTYTLQIDVHNSVTLKQSISADILFTEIITNVQLNVNPYVQNTFPVMMFLNMKTGSHATSVWKYGKGNGTEIIKSKFNDRFISSKREFDSPGVYNITVVVWNRFTLNTTVSTTVTIISPVPGIQVSSPILLSWPSNTVYFRFSRDKNSAVPTNPYYKIEFGDGTSSSALPLNLTQMDYSHRYVYKAPGCYDAKLQVFNQASHADFMILVKIEEAIENLTLQALQYDWQSSFSGRDGYGKDKNLFPKEYPVSFRAAHSKGTCVKYEWFFGNNESLTTDSKSTVDHHYALPGNYTVRVRVSNSNRVFLKTLNIGIEWSIVGLYLVSSSPSLNAITFIVFCAQIGNNSNFILDTGDNKNITLSFMSIGNGYNEMTRYISPEIKLPFDASVYYSTVVNHTYSKKGKFQARVNGWNKVSHKTALTDVIITDSNCLVPGITMYGGGESLETASRTKYGRPFTIDSRINISCPGDEADRIEAKFGWVIYRADVIYNKNSSGPPDKSRKIENLPGDVVLNSSSITISLDPGYYLLQLTVTLSKVGITNTVQRYIMVMTPSVQATIKGGSARSRGWETDVILDASESFDPMYKGNLTFEWRCKQVQNEYVFGKGGCFGNGNNLVESEGPIFTIRNRSLLESVTYSFTVTVTTRDINKRAGQFTQNITIVQGKPPDLNIRCLHNCGKKVTADEQLALEAYCTDCVKNDTNLEYLWSAWDVDTGKEMELWPSKTLTSKTSKYVVVIKKVFKQDKKYFLKVEAKRKGGSSGFAKLQFQINSPPRDGKCEFEKNEITELKTLHVSCENWKEDDTPLSYEVLIQKDNNPEPLLLWYGPELSNCKVILDAGREENNYTVQLIARVKDVYGAVADTPHNVKVLPMPSNEITSEKFLTSAESLGDILASGDSIGAIQLTTAIGSIVNERGSAISTEDKAKIRSKLVKGMTKVAPLNLQAVRQLSGALETVTKQPEELSVDSQVSTTTIFTRAVSVVSSNAKKVGDTVEPYQIELASKIAFSAISNSLVAAATSSERIFSNGDGSASDLEKTKDSSSQLVELTNQLGSAILNGKVPGENATEYKANNQVLSVKKILSDDLDTGSQASIGKLGFHLPGKDVLLRGLTDDQIGLMVSSMPLNPFGGTNSSEMIRSEPMSLIITGNNSKELEIEGLSSYIDIFLKNHQQQNSTSSVNVTKSWTNMTVHSISNVRANTTILIDIIPQNRSISLNVFLKYEDHPTHDDYDMMMSLPRSPVSEDENITSPGPYTFFVSSEYVTNSGNYYIGVSPIKDDKQLIVNYTFDPYVAGCYYWDKQHKIWTCKGCKVGNKTSRAVTHCQCTHLTWFGGDFFVPPNKLDIRAAITNLQDIEKSWPMMIAIGIVGGLFILALVWARRQDRNDLTKIGLIVVPDSDPTDRFRYEVTVYTGRMARQTTANISMILYGDLNESHPIALKDKDKPIFESGSIDSFLVTVPFALGSLNYLRIWHDNSGVWPAWYLNQVIVRDIDTDERFVFLCYKWFACDEDDGQVVRVVPVAGKDELREFTYLFRNRAKKDFSDAHLWFSIALRPPRSVFTRVQRISCCFSLLLCTMMTNVMWYDTPKGYTQNDYIIFKSGFITITWLEVRIGILSSLIVFPINLLIVQMFRNTERKPKKKRKPEEAIRLETAKSKSDQILTLNDIHAVPRSESSAAFLESQIDPEKTTNKRAPSIVKKVQKKKLVNRQDSFEDDLLSLLKETQMLDQSQMGKGSFEKLSEKDSIDSEPEDIVKEHINHPFEMPRKSLSPVVSEGSFDWTANDNTKLVKPQPIETLPVQIRIPKLKFLFPWWFIYVGWIFCIITSVVSAAVTILYGVSFPIEKQGRWLVSMFISIAQDVFISQPLKVIGFALFFALIWKKPEKEDESLTAELAKDEEWLKENVGGRRRNALIAQRPKYLPPDEVMLKKARIRRFKERKMFSVIREIVLYAMFVWVVLVIAYGQRDPNSEVLNQGVENMLTGAGNSWLVEYTKKKPRNETLRKFLKVSGVNKYWNWTKTILMPSLYNGPWYNGQEDDPGFMADRSSWVVGVARIRQLRVKTDTCEVSKVFQGTLKECNEPYSWSSEDTTAQFKPGWLPALSNFTTPNRAWKYRSGTDLKSLPFLGRLAFYSGGGYAEDLGPNLKDAEKRLQEMESNNWIDKLTRSVFIEVTVYNAYTNLYCVIFLVLEVSASGGTFPFVELLITRIDRYAGNFMIFVLIFELAFVLFVIFFTYKLIKGVIKIGIRYYFKKYWNWVELALVSLSWTAIVLYFVRFGLNTLTQMNYRKTPHEFVNFHHLAISDQLFGYVYAFVVFLVSLKFLRLFRFNRRMSLLASTLRNASLELWCFSLVFGIVFMAFIHFCYLVFSTDLYMFHTVMSTVETLVSVMLGKFSYERLLQTNRLLAPLMFFLYSVIVVFVLINMFVSIIIENFQVVKRNNDLQSNEYEIVDFMLDQFKIWLGWSSWGVMFSKNKVGLYPGGKPKYKKRKRERATDKLDERIDRLVDLIQEVYFDNSDVDEEQVINRLYNNILAESHA